MEDWKQKAKEEYLAGGVTCRELAKKYGKQVKYVQRICTQEHWRELRQQTAERATEAAMRTAAAHRAKRMERMQRAADRLMDKVEQAVEELDIRLVKQKERVREISYESPDAPDCPTHEVIREEERYVQTAQTVDRSGVKQLASAMRELQGVQMLRSEEELRERQAKIALLEKQAAREDEETPQLQICFDETAEAYAQ